MSWGRLPEVGAFEMGLESQRSWSVWLDLGRGGGQADEQRLGGRLESD